MLSTTAAILLGAATLVAADSIHHGQAHAAAAHRRGTATYSAGVEGTGTMGVTNPTAAVMGTPVNQTSMSRLLTLNSVDDFCIFAPPEMGIIADTETEEVAWCTKPRNNARLIPDGTLTAVTFIKTDFYVQIMGYGNFTNINIKDQDMGGELDPHGAYGSGNPIGGNVTTNITGVDLNVGEWMQYISYNQFCIRACTNANSTYSAAAMCWHELDEMGCFFVMPGDYTNQDKFESCEADVAYPPGWYPTATVDGVPQFSTFAQYFTGIYTSAGTPVPFTVGTTVTPSSAAFTPASSNCVTTSSIANGLLAVVSGVTSSGSGSPAAATGGSSNNTAAATGKGGSAGAKPTGSNSGSSPSGSSTGGSSGARGIFPGAGALVGLTLASVVTVAAGVSMVL